jgi:iron complex outermembrane receptor protein
MFVASWHINDDSQIYAKAVTGFRSGGINAVAATEEAFKTPFDAETMTSYELGYKGRMINNRLQLNAAYFYNDFKDIQAEVFVPELLSQNVVNAGDAKIQGMEIEVLAKPTEQFELGLNLAWLEPEYKDFYEGGVDVSDDRVFPYSPELSGNAIIKYQYGNTPFGQLSAHINYSWKDDHYFGLQEDTSVDIESYSLLDARISLSNIPIGNESLRVSLWGKNLEDTEYWDSALNLVFITVAQWADPRSYGLEFSYQF